MVAVLLRRILSNVLVGLWVALSFSHGAVFAASGELLEVNRNSANLRAEANTSAKVIGQLNQGDRVLEIVRDGQWVSIRAPQLGGYGWIHSSLVDVTKPVSVASKAVNNVVDSSALKSIAPAQQSESKSITQNYSMYAYSIADLGYEHGVSFEGSEPAHTHHFFFPVPTDAKVKFAKLRIYYKSSPLLDSNSNLRLYIDEVPRGLVQLPSKEDSQYHEISLNSNDFRGQFLKVTVKSALLVSDSSCKDERINASFLHILPDTSLLLSLENTQPTVRSHWQMLPKDVTISLPPQTLDEHNFNAALAVANLLTKAGKKVHFARLPIPGDIIIAPRTAITTFIKLMGQDRDEEKQFPIPNRHSNAFITRASGIQFLALTEPYDVVPFYPVAPAWINLLSDRQYHALPITRNAELDESLRLSVAGVGLDTSTRYINTQAQWLLTINPGQLPPGYLPRRLHLDIVSTPNFSDQQVMFYSYLNGVLQDVHRLDNTGSKQSLSITLPAKQLRHHNSLRLVAQREKTSGNCSGDRARYPIQILPSSSLTVHKESITPQRFSDLHTYLADQFTTYLPYRLLQQAEASLTYVNEVLSGFPVTVDYKNIVFYKESEQLQPNKPFVVIGKANIETDYAPVSFDKGRILIENAHRQKLLDLDRMSNINVAQIIQASGYYGLSVTPASDAISSSKLAGLHLVEDDVAFLDSTGILLTLDSTQPGLARVNYPDHESWFTLMGEYSFWVFALAWIVITMLVIYLYGKSTQHKRNSQGRV